MPEEISIGLERLKEIFESRRILSLSEPTQFRNTFTYYFTVRAYQKEWDFTLSRESISDLPAMKTYQESANRLARILEQRFKNVSPRLFQCSSGRSVEIEATWPAEPFPQRAASYIRTSVRDFISGEVAKCFVSVTYQQSIFDIKPDPFVIHEGMTNSVRACIDAGKITFYPEEAHPAELQEVRLSLETPAQSPEEAVEQFLLRKVLRLAFRADSSARRVWITDPWDASYLGIVPRDLAQSAQILAAQHQLVTDESGEFAAIGEALLARAREFEGGTTAHKTRAKEGAPFDVFISHASEDKETFVRPLVSALEQKGLRVWFDEFTLRLGDSLRRTIDDGLRKSRFGVVILSPAFFAKEWPQRELDALVGREVAGKKVVLPVWHNISASGVREYSPLLADRFAVASSQGVSTVVNRIVDAVVAAEGEGLE